MPAHHGQQGPKRSGGGMVRRMFWYGFAGFIVWLFFDRQYDHEKHTAALKPVPATAKSPVVNSRTQAQIQRATGASQQQPFQILSAHDIPLDANRHVKIEVVLGDITEEKTDAIFHSANPDLMNHSGLAMAIARKAGPEMQQMCNEHIKALGKQASISDHLVTRCTGGLRCKQLFHIVCPPWSGGREDEERDLNLGVRKALAKADGLHLSSISMPALGTGVLEMPLEKSVATMVGAVMHYFGENAQTTKIKQIRFCNFDTKTSMQFEREFEKQWKQHQLAQPSPSKQ